MTSEPANSEQSHSARHEFNVKTSQALATSLARRRDMFNAQFYMARRAKSRIEPEAFKEHLRTTVAPIVDAVYATRPEKVDEVVDVLYEFSLELIGNQFLGSGSRHPEIAHGWKQILPELPHLVAESPRKFIGSVTNALYNLSSDVVPSYTLWAHTMVQIGRRVDHVSTALEAGKVAAWRAGLAHYRIGALQSLLRLQPDVAMLALGLPENSNISLGVLYEKLSADPWAHPAALNDEAQSGRKLKIAARIGSFKGFGGPFIRPPVVFISDGQIHVYDFNDCWVLSSDVFGATLQRVAPPAEYPSIRVPGPFEVSSEALISRNGQQHSFPEIGHCTSYAGTDHTLAVTSALSHTLYVVALQR